MGALSDRYSPRIILCVSGLFVALGIALSGFVTAVWHLYLAFGIVGGIGAGGLWIPATIMVMR